LGFFNYIDILDSDYTYIAYIEIEPELFLPYILKRPSRLKKELRLWSQQVLGEGDTFRSN